jgi:CHAD domain-containing protein
MMAFELKADEPVSRGIRRVVRGEIDKALASLAEPPEGGPDEAVHDARKRLKKVRAVLRLVRRELGSKAYREENVCFRDAARPLTEVRDARVLVDALDGLAEHFGEEVPAQALGPVREMLVGNQEAVRRHVLEEEDAVAAVTAALSPARGRVKAWAVGDGWSALRAGLKRTYRNGRRGLAEAQADPSVENLHEWRKQVKYLWHQVQLLEPARPDTLKELTGVAHELADLLGDDHDLAVLRQTVLRDLPHFEGDTLGALLALLDRRRAELQAQAYALGGRLFADRPGAFVKRLRRYWRKWRSGAGTAPAAS